MPALKDLFEPLTRKRLYVALAVTNAVAVPVQVTLIAMEYSVSAQLAGLVIGIVANLASVFGFSIAPANTPNNEGVELTDLPVEVQDAILEMLETNPEIGLDPTPPPTV